MEEVGFDDGLGCVFQMHQLMDCFGPNVFAAEDPVYIVHGTHTIVLAELQCMKSHVRRSHKWKYLINLTGEEFPLMTNLELVSLLSKINGSNIVDRKSKTISTKKRKASHNFS